MHRRVQGCYHIEGRDRVDGGIAILTIRQGKKGDSVRDSDYGPVKIIVNTKTPKVFESVNALKM
jgi:hypothetical protein